MDVPEESKILSVLVSTYVKPSELNDISKPPSDLLRSKHLNLNKIDY